MKRIWCTAALLLLAQPGYSTTVQRVYWVDPLTGDKVFDLQVVSYNSSIYSSDSRYDLVFFPVTSVFSICFNPRSGYGAFDNDFQKLSGADEKAALTAWLAKNYDPKRPPKTHQEKLAWIEQVYLQRKKDDDFWCKFYRLMAYINRDDATKSLEYVKKAMPFLREKQRSNPESLDKLEVLFLLGEYSMRLGNLDEAARYFEQVKAAHESGQKKVERPVEDPKVSTSDDAPKAAKAAEPMSSEEHQRTIMDPLVIEMTAERQLLVTEMKAKARE